MKLPKGKGCSPLVLAEGRHHRIIVLVRLGLSSRMIAMVRLGDLLKIGSGKSEVGSGRQCKGVKVINQPSSKSEVGSGKWELSLTQSYQHDHTISGSGKYFPQPVTRTPMCLCYKKNLR